MQGRGHRAFAWHQIRPHLQNLRLAPSLQINERSKGLQQPYNGAGRLGMTNPLTNFGSTYHPDFPAEAGADFALMQAYNWRKA